MEKDVLDTDRYSRLLRYVFLSDGRLVKEVLETEGYAEAKTYPPDIKYTDRFLEAEKSAKATKKGLWGQCVEADPAPNVLADSTGVTCDSAYPDVCIPPSPPDLDCGEITHNNFEVLQPDPHRFDRDKDGIGCER